MIDLKKLYEEHPECFQDSVRFKAHLTDLYPEEKKSRINVLAIMLEQGVLTPAKTEDKLDDVAFCKQIIDNYGYDEKLVQDCFNLFVAIYETNSSTKSKSGNTEAVDGDCALDNYDREKFEIEGTVLTGYKGGQSDIEIPYDVTKIGKGAFKYHMELRNVIIPDSCTIIGEEAFCGCLGLTAIKIPGSVVKIEEAAFFGCSSLKTVTLCEGVKHLCDHVFEDCAALTNISLPRGLKIIEEFVFWKCSSLKSITIPNSVTAVGSGAFGYCSQLTIHCEVSRQPSGWYPNWNEHNCPVIWNGGDDYVAPEAPDFVEFLKRLLGK